MTLRNDVGVRKRSQVRRGKAGDPCTIQDLYLQECLLGIRLAETSPSVEHLRLRLAEQLPQNSPETRRLYAARICRWSFPDGSLDSAPLAAWQAYHDDQMLLDHFRVRYLESIPLLGKFVLSPLSAVDIGSSLSKDTVGAFVSRECGVILPKTVERIRKNLSKLGFLARVGTEWIRAVPAYDPTSVVLELHRVFGQNRTIPFSEIAAHPFWRYIGVADTVTLERILYAAVKHRLLAKFVKSDELNQVTTGYSYQELLSLRLHVQV